jgi:hypothetical protein
VFAGGAVLAGPVANYRSLPESGNANAFRIPRNYLRWTLERRGDCKRSQEQKALDRYAFVALGPEANAMPISPAWACPRTSIFGRRRADRTNATARLLAVQSYIVSLALALSKERTRLKKRQRGKPPEKTTEIFSLNTFTPRLE